MGDELPTLGRSFSMSTALVIIDMQEQFRRGAIKVRPKVVKAIAHARAMGWPIVNVSYSGPRIPHKGTPTLHGIRRSLNARDVIQVYKTEDNGGRELAEALRYVEPRITKLIFCGVNATCCVADTVACFAKLHPNIMCVISDASCDSFDAPDRHRVAAEQYIRLPNVKAEDIWEVA
jgi:nicotinamidase-related amidase